MTRWAIYARYSSDMQDERSIEDQIRICRARVVELGGDVVAVYADYELSGAHLRSRPNAVRLLEDGKARRFDALIAEHTDRISRDQEDMAHLYKRLTHAGVRIMTLFEGEIDEIRVGVGGMMGALFLKGLAQKIRRGQEGQALKGKSPGGLSYGYEVVREIGADGEPIRGQRRVKPDEAATIIRIFEEAASGRSARAIAADLNRDHVPAPAGGAWRASAINGNRARGTGVLWNAAYVGKLVYNRVTMVKDPDSGRRISRVNPSDKWVITSVPELRIVTDELWKAVQNHKALYVGLAVHRARRPRHVFSGLVRCGPCGGAYTVKNNDQLCCSTRREAGSCANNRTIRVPVLEQRVFAGLRSKLLDPATMSEFMREYHLARQQAAGERRGRRDQIAGKVAAIDRKLAHIVSAISEGFATPALKTEMVRLENEKADLSREMGAISVDENVVTMHPSAPNAYRELLEGLQTALASGDLDEQGRQEAAEVLRPLVAKIDIFPGAGRGEVTIQLHGVLAQIINIANGVRSGAVASAAMMVAEERYRHYRATTIIAC